LGQRENGLTMGTKLIITFNSALLADHGYFGGGFTGHTFETGGKVAKPIRVWVIPNHRYRGRVMRILGNDMPAFDLPLNGTLLWIVTLGVEGQGIVGRFPFTDHADTLNGREGGFYN